MVVISGRMRKSSGSVVDFIISQQLADGGFNCRLNRSGARHSPMHSTISVLEGIREYIAAGYAFRAEELNRIEGEAQEFLLRHRLFKLTIPAQSSIRAF